MEVKQPAKPELGKIPLSEKMSKANANISPKEKNVGDKDISNLSNSNVENSSIENKNSENKNVGKTETGAKNKDVTKKTPFGSLKTEIMQEMHSGKQGSAEQSQRLSKGKLDMAYLKTAIMEEMPTSPKEQSQRLSKGKIDMAYLKATIQDTLKQKPKTDEKKQSHDRVPTGIEGFDQTIEGGLVKNSIILLGGGPGSGKSIFGMQYLVNGIELYNEAGVYLSFEEEPKTILEDMGRFNWDLQKKIDDKKLAILYFSPEQVDRVIYIGGGPVREVIEEIGAKRIVIDSITAFTLLYKTENDRRRALMSLFKTLKKWNCTTILISEQTLMEDHSSVIEEYESEGVIFLYHTKKGDVRERSIEIFKMRGTDHSTKINPVKISSDGLTVYPDEQVY